jgi:hypothetical protein
MTAIFNPRGMGLAIFVAISLLAVGCGPTRKEVAPVRGKVTYNGKGVGGVSILFSPMASTDNRPGKSAIGITDADGGFRLTTYVAADGAVVAKHRVEIAASDPFQKLPGTYRGPTEIDVVSGENVFDFKLD